MKTSIKIILISALIALIIITAGCVSNDSNQSVKTPTVTPTPTTTQTFFPTEIPENYNKTNSKFSLIVSEKYSGNVTDIMKSASGRNKLPNGSEYNYLLNLRITCKSLGSETNGSVHVDPYENIYLKVNGVNYKAKSSTRYPNNYPEIQAADLKVNQAISGWLYFIVPAGFAQVNMNAEGMESDIVDLIYWG